MNEHCQWCLSPSTLLSLDIVIVKWLLSRTIYPSDLMSNTELTCPIERWMLVFQSKLIGYSIRLPQGSDNQKANPVVYAFWFTEFFILEYLLFLTNNAKRGETRNTLQGINDVMQVWSVLTDSSLCFDFQLQRCTFTRG